MSVGCSPNPYPGETGRILHVGLRVLPKSFDPPQIEDESSGKISAPIYEGLLSYHPFARPYTLQPSLAASLPEVSEDALTYTFHLKRGVTFHDNECFEDGQGREMVAEDVLWAWKRFAHPSTHSKGWWLFDGKVEGLNEWRDTLKADITKARENGEEVGPLWGIERDVPGFEWIDEYTLRIHLAKPYPQFLWVLAMQYTSVYPKEAVEHYGDQFRNNPVGTGPFMMKEYNPVYRAVFMANPDYREVRFPTPETASRCASCSKISRVGSTSPMATSTS